MQVEKRKREDEGESSRNKGMARQGDDGVKAEMPADEEVEEFFLMVKRMQVALEYFKKRKGRQITSAPWIPVLEREDFGIQGGPGNANAGLDLNSDPASEIKADTLPDSG